MEERQKIKTADFNKYLAETRGLERDYIGEVLSSRTNAWRIAGVCACFTLIAFVAALLGLRQTPPPPVILRVDNATGAVDMLTTIKESAASYGEIVDIYWLNKYVLNRESYDYNNIQMLYDTTALLSTEEVQKEYYSVFKGENARDKVLGNCARILVTIRSITPHKQGGSAVVRFTTEEISSTGQAGIVKNLIATIGYTYANVPILERDRRINPLGFQVTSYRADPELID